MTETESARRRSSKRLASALSTTGAAMGVAVLVGAAAVPASAQNGTVAGGQRDVTYEDVLRAPDDIDLNYAWAQKQIREGNLLGASATLERILLINPNIPRVRVLYAIVLYRLDNLTEAERELRRALDLVPGGPLRAELEHYLADVQRRQDRTRFSVVFNFGYQFDTNRNAAPEDQGADGFTTGTQLTEDDQRHSDHAFRGLIRAFASHDLGLDRPHRLVGGLSLYDSEQVDLSDLTVRSVEAHGGVRFDFRTVHVEPVLYVRQTNLADEPLVSIFGFRIRGTARLDDNFTLFSAYQLEAQEYRGISRSPASRLRRGPEMRVTAGGTVRLSQRWRVNGGAQYIHKAAHAVFNDYEGVQLFLEPTVLLGDGFFAIGRFAWQTNWYDGPDRNLSPRTREDDIYRARLTFGAPLKAIFRDADLPLTVGNIVVTVGGEYYRAGSTVGAYDYDNWRVFFGLSRQFDF